MYYYYYYLFIFFANKASNINISTKKVMESLDQSLEENKAVENNNKEHIPVNSRLIKKVPLFCFLGFFYWNLNLN